MAKTRKRKTLLLIPILLVILIVTVPWQAHAANNPKDMQNLNPNTHFYVPPPLDGAREHLRELAAQGNRSDAAQIASMVRTPQAVWFTGGSPQSVQREVRNTVRNAAAKGEVPVLVAYNIPFRDCAQFSAGGATTVAEYTAWIDAFAAGIGSAEAVVILEPDGLGIIPFYNPLGDADGSSGMDWCQPAEADPQAAAAERFFMLNHAVDALKAQANTSVYLDGTHSGWLSVGDAAHRLAQAGVARANGFFLNASNYHFSPNLVYYGTWISSCLAVATNAAEYNGCPNQYWNGGPPTNWQGTALNHFGVWSDGAEQLELNVAGINARYASMLGDIQPTAHFVIDTSRNGQGPWMPPAGVYPDPQDWCNPPGRGLGLLPTANTGHPLLDAYLWIKLPGASDGECTRGLGPAGETVDPEWGLIDPAAGAWFPEMALDLIANANPPLMP